jgi:sigma-B regulation protein RsbU (phosphoserine phosphatase)
MLGIRNFVCEEAFYMPIATEPSGFSQLVVGEACLIQKLLVPREPLVGPNFEVTYLVRAFSEVGGDFLDYFSLSDGQLGIYMGDVVGKGLPAAMYAALAMGSLRSIKKTGEEPAAVLELFNKRLLVRPVPSRYCASQYAVFDPVTLELRLANAGLPLPLHLSASGCRPLGEGGLPSGLFDFASYEQNIFRLAPGDAILFSTDGLCEASDKHGEQFGMSRLTNLCAMLDYNAPDLFLHSVFAAIEQFTGGRQSDDMTAVVLKVPSQFAPTAIRHPVGVERGELPRKEFGSLVPSETGRQGMPRLLIVDDDESMRKLLRVRLESSYEITDTFDPEEGLALALQQKPDAILLDLMMPRYSGFELCQTLSSLSFTQRIPVFIVSGESISRYKDFCENLGAKGFFSKPVDFDKLRQALTEIIEDSRHASRAEARVRLRTPLKLRGIDSTGAPFDLVTVTESVIANGFLCGWQANVKEGAVVEVYLAANEPKFIGKAQVVRVDGPGTPGQACDFQFLEKPIDWVLQ